MENCCKSLNFLMDCEAVYQLNILDYDYSLSTGSPFILKGIGYMGQENKLFAIRNMPTEYFERIGLARKQAYDVVAGLLSSSWFGFLTVHKERNVQKSTLLKLFFDTIGLSQVQIIDISKLRKKEQIGCTTLFFCNDDSKFKPLNEVIHKLPIDTVCKEGVDTPFHTYQANASIEVNVNSYTCLTLKADNKNIYMYVHLKNLHCNTKNVDSKYRHFVHKALSKRHHILIRISGKAVQDVLTNNISDVTLAYLQEKPQQLLFFESEEQVLKFAREYGIVDYHTFI